MNTTDKIGLFGSNTIGSALLGSFVFGDIGMLTGFMLGLLISLRMLKDSGNSF